MFIIFVFKNIRSRLTRANIHGEWKKKTRAISFPESIYRHFSMISFSSECKIRRAIIYEAYRRYNLPKNLNFVRVYTMLSESWRENGAFFVPPSASSCETVFSGPLKIFNLFFFLFIAASSFLFSLLSPCAWSSTEINFSTCLVAALRQSRRAYCEVQERRWDGEGRKKKKQTQKTLKRSRICLGILHVRACVS